MATTDRPMRKDAARNRQRILDGARELFGERGLSATLNDVAHHAGVGVGTVYRHFPDKEELIEELFEQQFAALVAIAEEALADPDPWHGLCRWMEQGLEMQCRNRALKELVAGSPAGRDRVQRVRSRLMPISEEVIRRARETGQLRRDVEPTDMAIVQLMVAGLFEELDAGSDPELWRRYLGIVLRGLSARPDELPPLARPAPAPEDIDRIMSAAKSRHGR